MRLLLSGATGFIGSHLAQRLVADGHEVHAVVRPTSDLAVLGTARAKIAAHVYDESANDLTPVVAAARPDVVLHLASLYLTHHKPEQSADLVRSNVLFGTLLLEAMHACDVRRLINTGTTWQHFENANFDPVNLYAATKQAFQDVVQFYVRARDFHVVTLKLSDTYGPNDPRPKIFKLLRRTAENGETLRMSPGEQKLDPLFIDDAVAAFVRALEIIAAGAPDGGRHFVYTALTGDARTLREIVALYGEALGRDISVEWGGLPYRPREVFAPFTGGENLPGWTPKISLSEGLRRLAQDG